MKKLIALILLTLTLNAWALYPTTPGGVEVGEWLTAYDYKVDDLLHNNEKFYKALTNHTSGVFATDLANNDLVEMSDDLNRLPSATDNALPRFDGVTGDVIQDSLVVVDDLGAMTGLTRLLVDSTTEGSRPCPPMTEVQRDAIVGPTASDCIYNSNTNQLNVYDGIAWASAGGGPIEWLTSTVYKIDDLVWEQEKFYKALTNHTSGVFATDLANNEWIQMSNELLMSNVIFPTADEINGPVTEIDTARELYNHTASSGIMSGCGITDNGDGTIDIASGVASLKATSDPHGKFYHINVSAQAGIALTDLSTNYVSIDYNTGTPVFNVSTSISSFNCIDKCVAYVVARDGNNLSIVNALEQNVDGNRKTRRWMLHTQKFYHERGGTALAETGTRNVSVTSGRFYFMLNEIVHSAFDTSAADNFEYHYKTGAGWTSTAASTQIDNLQYNTLGTGLTTLSNNRYKTDWVYLELGNIPTLHLVYSQGQYQSLSDAKAAGVPSDLPPILAGTGEIIGKIIYKKSGAFAGVVASVFEEVFVTTSATTHNGLSGLQGGALSEYYHLDSLEFGFLDGIDQSVSTTSAVEFLLADIDNLRLDANTLSSIDVNGNIILSPNGTGVIQALKPHELAQLITPATPASGNNRFYSKSTNYLYNLKDTGIEQRLAEGDHNLDVFYNEPFIDSLAAGFTKGNDPTFLVGADDYDSTLSDDTTLPIHGTTSLHSISLTPASAIDDWLVSEVIDIDPKQTNKEIGVSINYFYDGADNEIEFVLYDVTNSVILNTNGLDFFQNEESNSARFTTSVFIPTGVTQIRWGFHVKAMAAISIFRIDDIQLSTNPFVYKNISIEDTCRFHTRVSNASTNTMIARFGNIACSVGNGYTFASIASTQNSTNGLFKITDSATSGTEIEILKDGNYTITNNDSTSAADYAGISLNSTQLTTSVINITAANRLSATDTAGAENPTNTVWSGDLKAGDIVRPHTHTVQVAGSIPARASMTISGTASSEHVVATQKTNKQVYKISQTGSALTNPNGEIEYNLGTATIVNSGDALVTAVDNAGSTRTEFTANKKVIVTLHHSAALNTAGSAPNCYKNGTAYSAGDSSYAASTVTLVSCSMELEAGDHFTVGSTSSNTNGSGGTVYTSFVAYAYYATSLGATPVQRIAHLKDEKTSGTAGGGTSANTLYTRDLNVAYGDNFVTLSANQFSMGSGKYKISACAPSWRAIATQIFLYNVTDAQYEHDFNGSSEWTPNTANTAQVKTCMSNTISLTATKTFEIRMFVGAGGSGGDGLGRPADSHANNPQDHEVYTEAEIIKLK